MSAVTDTSTKPDAHAAAAADADPALVPPAGDSNQLTSSPETDSALDALFNAEAASAPKPDSADAEASAEEQAPKSDDQTAEATSAESTKETSSSPEASEEGKTKPEPEATSSDKPLVEDLFGRKPSADAPAEPTPPKDRFGDVKLRADASPKTKETFENLKSKANAEIEAALAETARLSQELETLKKAVPDANKLPEAIENELKELRAFRATFDIERDPQFQEKFDARKGANLETVYSTLKAHGLADDQIEILKKMGDTERVDAIGDLLDKVPHASRLKIQAKLVENTSIDEERQRELAAAREKADQILRERAEAPAKKSEAFYKEVETHAKALISGVDFFSQVDVPANTPPAERARLEAQNKQAAQLQSLFVRALADESPKSKAETALGMVYAHRLKAENSALSSEVASLKKELDAIKKAGSVGRIGRTAPTTSSKPAPLTTLDAGANLDRLFQEAMSR